VSRYECPGKVRYSLQTSLQTYQKYLIAGRLFIVCGIRMAALIMRKCCTYSCFPVPALTTPPARPYNLAAPPPPLVRIVLRHKVPSSEFDISLVFADNYLVYVGELASSGLGVRLPSPSRFHSCFIPSPSEGISSTVHLWGNFCHLWMWMSFRNPQPLGEQLSTVSLQDGGTTHVCNGSRATTRMATTS